MDQKQQLTPAPPPQQPQQAVQPNNLPQQTVQGPQSFAQPTGLSTNQLQQQTPIASSPPQAQPQQTTQTSDISNPPVSSVANPSLPEKPSVLPENNIATKEAVDLQAPLKAKQLLQPSQVASNEQEVPVTAQSNPAPGTLSSQNNVDEQETDEDLSVELASWTASEFIAHEKPSYWHFAVIGVAIVISAIIYIFTQELISSFAVIVLGAVFTIYGSAKPRTVQYRLTSEGVYTDEKLHLYNDFKSFSTIETTGLPYIQLISRKRFMMPLTLYTEPSSVDQITEIIGKHVPYDQKHQDPVDKLSAKLKF